METAKRSIENDVCGRASENDVLRFNLRGVRSEIVGEHPLQSLRHSAIKAQSDLKRSVLADTYGSAFTAKMDLEAQIFSKFRRPPGFIPSSMLGYDVLTGNLDEFGVEDYLNDPETFSVPDMHHGMEVRLGLSKGPICPSLFS